MSDMNDGLIIELYASIEKWDKEFENFENKNNAHYWYHLYKIEQTQAEWYKKLYFDLLHKIREENSNDK